MKTVCRSGMVCLFVLASCGTRPPSTGFRLDLMPPCHPAPPGLVIERTAVVVEIHVSESLGINGQLLQQRPLLPTLEDIFRTRAIKTLFIAADPDVRYEELIEVISALHASSLFTHLILLTPKQLEENNKYNCF